MKLTTTRFGTIEVAEEVTLHFSDGIPGFPDTRRYIILDHDKESPIKWLQAVEQGDLAFPIIDPYDLVADYRVTVSPGDLAALGVDQSRNMVTFVILTIPNGAPERTTANLRAPVVVNPNTRLAKQVLVVEDYPIRYPIAETNPVGVECAT
ncbi:MAG TPA: flagellar assembly protein FliW [Nitrospirales bacterium]|nr:flagellar assembly protein FliW [Nitrospirales bacterium]